jgi:uncharacterized OB-fold protein
MNEPNPDMDARAYFLRASETDNFVLPRCERCGHWAWPPRELCDRCGASGWRWEPASARGTLLSLATVWRGAGEGFQEEVPYDLVLVKLDEGPEFITRAASDQLTSGKAVRLVWRPVAGRPWPCAVPEEEP